MIKTSDRLILKIGLMLFLMLLIFNSALLLRQVGVFYFPGELTKLDITRQGAEILSSYLEQTATDAGVIDNKAVSNLLAQFNYEVDRASTPEEIVKIEAWYGREIQDVIIREQDNNRREAILSLIKQDPNLSKVEQGRVLINNNKDHEIVIEDMPAFLSDITKQKIYSEEMLLGTWPFIEIIVEDGKATLVTSRTISDRLKMYEAELSAVRNKLNQTNIKTGYAELNGPGIQIGIFDANNGLSSVEIVHDYDIRNVVNELFAAGAKGVVVGGQRLITTSSIRCAGPVILVNQKPVAVNPVVIEAVGDPKILASGLDLIVGELEQYGITFSITEIENITLVPYKK